MPRAELLRHTVIVLSVILSVRLLQAFLVARRKLSAETSNTSRYQYLLGFVLKNIGFEASFTSHGVIWIYTRFVALAGDLDFSEDKSADN